MTGMSSDRARPIRLRPIETPQLEEAVTLLARGFPAHDRDFWQRGLGRMAGLQSGGCGYFLDSGGSSVGLMLALRSTRQRADGEAFPVVNLSSWYIEPAHRWRAPMMLRAIIDQNEAVFTDLTAAPQLYKLNDSLGFSVWNTGMILASGVPWAALAGRRDTQMLSFAEAAALLSATEAELLDWHQRDGCIAVVLREGDAIFPLLFRPIRRMGVRFAQVIYAGSRKAVIRNLPAIMRFLAGQGILFVSVDAHREDCPPGAYFRVGRQRFWRGPIERDQLDYAYSELVLFGVS